MDVAVVVDGADVLEVVEVGFVEEEQGEPVGVDGL